MTQHPEEGTLHAYIDGELSPAETAALELHVGECASCAAALAEARGLVAGASRVITTLDAAPSSAATPAVLIADVRASPSKHVVRPLVFRVPYARAAALLLLVGGTAFVFDRTGTFERGPSTRAESVMAGAAESDFAATAPVEAAAPPTTAPIQAPEQRSLGVTQSTGAATGTTGSARRESVAPRPTVATTAAPEFAGRGVAGGVVRKDAASPRTEPSDPASSDAASEVARPAALNAAPPPPAPARMAATQERATAHSLAPTAVRYRTRDGRIVTLTEEPLRTSFAGESLATRQSAPQSAQRTAPAATAAQPINSYRWSSAERVRTYTLSGPLTVAELEALSRRLSELERLP